MYDIAVLILVAHSIFLTLYTIDLWAKNEKDKSLADSLSKQLRECRNLYELARKNDQRDEKGRFTKVDEKV